MNSLYWRALVVGALPRGGDEHGGIAAAVGAREQLERLVHARGVAHDRGRVVVAVVVVVVAVGGRRHRGLDAQVCDHAAAVAAVVAEQPRRALAHDDRLGVLERRAARRPGRRTPGAPAGAGSVRRRSA